MKNLRNLTLLGVMTAIILVMLAIPGIGFIPVGPINATIVHIPVIIIAVVKGPKLGAILGTIFGFASMVNVLLRPTVTSCIFMNPIISVLPRILIGLVVGYIAKYLVFSKKGKKIYIMLAAGIGSLVNTIGVLSLIYFIYAQQYMTATGKAGKSALTFLFGIATTNGLVEMILSIVIATPIVLALLRFEKKRI